MIDINKVDWKQDGITRSYIRENIDLLTAPELMKPAKLGETVTYCRSIYNPYAEELMRRSGHLEKFNSTWSANEAAEIFRRSCRYHGFSIY